MLRQDLQTVFSFLVFWKSSAPSQYHPPRLSHVPPKESLLLSASSFCPAPKGSPFKPGLHIVVRLAEHACDNVSKSILKPSTYRLQIFLVKDQ